MANFFYLDNPSPSNFYIKIDDLSVATTIAGTYTLVLSMTDEYQSNFHSYTATVRDSSNTRPSFIEEPPATLTVTATETVDPWEYTLPNIVDIDADSI